MTTNDMTVSKEKYDKLYRKWRRDLRKWEEHKMSLLDDIEKLEIQLWKHDENQHKSEEYLVGKIERLEDELQKRDCKGVYNLKTRL